MSHRTRNYLVGTALVLLVTATATGWRLYALEREKTASLEAQVEASETDAGPALKPIPTAEGEPFHSWSVTDRIKRELSKHDMLAIKKAYETYYTQNLQWPEEPSALYQLLRGGAEAFQSPWPGVRYHVQLMDTLGPDGTVTERPLVTCEPPGKPTIRVPDVPVQ